MARSSTRRTAKGDLALVAAALCFGATFVVVQDAIERVEPVPFLAVRFLIGAGLLWPFARRRPRSAGEGRDGVLAGVALLVGYLLQTIGLQYTDPATSAFITYLLVVFVPLLSLVAFRRRPHPLTLVAVAVAVGGLVLLTDPGGSSGLGRGEVLTLGCALAYAVHVLVLGRTAHRHDPMRLATIQVAVVGLVCLVPGAGMGGYDFPASALAAAAATGVMATAVAFACQVFGQRTVPPTRVALVLLLEPVFAAVISAFGGDPLSTVQYLGAGSILIAVVVGEAVPGWLDHRVELRQAGVDNDRSQGDMVG
ncbi:MAG: DMT family transporter [Acidimicrobiales bacterium]|nr:DMT family transporter [Acidimicrobiales bacterium]